MSASALDKTIAVLGSGPAGLISAHVLLKDGFTHVEVLTRDRSAGGTWAEEHVPPDLYINNVHGEYRFSSLPMPTTDADKVTGGRLGGDQMRMYMESFAERFLKGKIRYNTAVTNVRRAPEGEEGKRWIVSVHDTTTGQESQLRYDKIVLCTGACNNPKFPPNLSPEDATKAGFTGPVFHTYDIKQRADELLAAVKPLDDPKPGHAVVIGGGKSGWDTAALLANRGRKVSLVFEVSDGVLGAAKPLPDAIRKSRFLAILSPSRVLRTRLERFLHTTWLGSKLCHFIWRTMTNASFDDLGVPKDSPLRHVHTPFWSLRLNDEGVPTPDRFFALVAAGKIELIAPARAAHFAPGGAGVVLEDGTVVPADAVVLATGYGSSWRSIMDQATYEELGLDEHAPPPEDAAYRKQFEYASLADPAGTGALLRDAALSNGEPAATVYRGIVPAKNILQRDFAINGGIIVTNNGYVYEACAHWIASYLRGDAFLRLPPTPAAAAADAEKNNSWLRKRYPGMLGWANECYRTDAAMLSWPQLVDTLLEDMGLPIMRSGGNWLTWPFKVVDLKEIEHLTEERAEKRAQVAAAA